MTPADPLSSYRIDAAAPLDVELQRVFTSELDDIRKRLRNAPANRTEAVHMCRKGIKRLRALALLGRDLDRRTCKALVQELRDAGRALSRARDAEVITNVISAFAKEHALGSSFGAAIEGAAARDVDSALHECEQALNRTEPLLRKLFGKDDRVRLPALRESMARIYRRARKARGRYRETRSQEDAHRLRRSVQRHLAQMRLVQALSRRPLSSRITELDKLAELLGEHHDLALLSDLLDRNTEMEETARASLRANADTRQREIDELALELAARLFEPKPERFFRMQFEEPAGTRRRRRPPGAD